MTYKTYGERRSVIVLHGGPGAIGSCSGLAQAIDNCYELHNYGQTLDAHVREIDELVEKEKLKEIILVGHSYGAWLAYLYAAKRPVSKIILIGSGAFSEKYLNQMEDQRISKLTDQEQQEVQYFFSEIAKGNAVEPMAYYGRLLSKMDSYALDDEKDALDFFDYTGHQKLMKEINTLRASGELLEIGKKIKCPITIIHGDSDPHPIKGITEPFAEKNIHYKLIGLEKCGHTPWHEIHAKEGFKKIIQEECLYFFETDRLKFRHFTVSDDLWFSEMNADSEVMKYFPSKLNKEESDQFLKRILESYAQNGFGLYAVLLKDDALPIGYIGLSKPNFESDFTPCVEIGWRLKQKYWHKGYATEGAKAVLRYGFDVLLLNKIYSFTAVINQPSYSVMNRIGMAKVKTFNHPKVKNSPLEEHVLYEIVGKNGQEIE